ncbi:MAG: hypothetical protein NVS3B18_14520 [Candidatus Dormibacteria bacterium]
MLTAAAAPATGSIAWGWDRGTADCDDAWPTVAVPARAAPAAPAAVLAVSVWDPAWPQATGSMAAQASAAHSLTIRSGRPARTIRL